MTAVAERVAAGAALLDEREPGWTDRISLAVLDMNHCNRCILGQLLGDDSNPAAYLTKARLLGIHTLDMDEIGLDCLGGVTQTAEAADLEALASEWSRLIMQRRAGAA